MDDTLHTIIDYACEQNIPFVFALNRKALGRSLNKAVPVSVVGIFSYDGAQVSGSRLLVGGGRPGMFPDRAQRPLSLSGLGFLKSSAPGSLLPQQVPQAPCPLRVAPFSVEGLQETHLFCGLGHHLCPHFCPRTSSTKWLS